MNQTFKLPTLSLRFAKNFWAHRKQNGWIVVEIALVAILSFYFLDYFVVTTYDTYFCRPAGDFERDHLLVGQVGVKPFEQDTLLAMTNIYALRDRVRALPEVQYACITDDFGGEIGGYHHSTFCAEADTTRQCSAYQDCFLLHEQYFEAQGLTPVKGSPSAAILSDECPEDGAVITRSMALALFDTDQAVGRRIVEYDFSDFALQNGGPLIVNRFTVAGVVKDYRGRPHERYSYAILTPRKSLMGNFSMIIIRLRPDIDTEAFMSKICGSYTNGHGSDLPKDLQMGLYYIPNLHTYTAYAETKSQSREDTILFSIMGTFIGLLLLNVILGTLGTFWLQIRKRTEDIGIMRSFGAKRRNVFWMLWCEAALLTLIACVIGQIIWLQFAINIGIAQGFTMTGTGHETDWVNNFWQHYLIVCVIQYILLLVVVTLGMVVPTFRAMYKRPVEALHHE
jgi:hypothetical protein